MKITKTLIQASTIAAVAATFVAGGSAAAAVAATSAPAYSIDHNGATDGGWVGPSGDGGMASAGAEAGQEPASTGAVVQAGPSTDDVGVQHVGTVLFSGFGCTFIGRSGQSSNGQHFAATSIYRGSGCRSSMVRAHICSSSGSCSTRSWVTDEPAELFAPSGGRVVWSEHKCSGCILVHRINH